MTTAKERKGKKRQGKQVKFSNERNAAGVSQKWCKIEDVKQKTTVISVSK